MSVSFNADEIFAIAEQIERNGAAFYRRAASIAKEPAVRERLGRLAEWEEGHERLFQSMRSALTPAEQRSVTFDPDGDAERYLQEMADRHVFRKDAPEALLKGGESSSEILEIAIGFERDSILLFQGVEALVPPSLGRDKVHALVVEEMSHVALLSREKAKLDRK